MQNIDTGENNDNFNKFENLQLTQPASLESLTCEQRKLLTDSPKAESSRNVHSDPEETQAKAKTRSRFSAALRKLSRSTRKKEKLPTKIHSSATVTESSELIVSSGAEDLPDTTSVADLDKKIKKKKKSSKSIFGIKKSKIAPKSEEAGKLLNVGEPEDLVDTVQHLEPIFQDKENEVVVTTEKLSPQFSRSQVQITIKSKKIETVVSPQDRLNNNQSPTSSPLPTSSVPINTTAITTALTGESETKANTSDYLTKSNEPVDKKKKLKTKITTQTPQKFPATTAQSKSKQQQDEITITQSSKDTPPKERAPTKPSRLTVTTAPSSTTTSQSGSSSGAVRKTATTTKAAIKLVTAAKSKKKSASKTTKGSNSLGNTSNNSTITTTTATATSAKLQETQDLMINPQRGHRLPRPTSTTTTSVASTTTTNTVKGTQAADDCTSTTNKELPVNLSNQNQTQQDQQRQTTTPTTPDSLAITNLPQTSSEIQSSLINASLTTQLPQTLPQRQQQHQKENLQATPSDSLVQLKIFSQTDDHISLAESVKTGILLGDDSTHYDSREHIKEPITTVHFAVGSPVRPPFPKALYEYSLQEPSIDLDKDLKESNSPITEANRRRIHYISQPTLYDEFNSLELKRAHFRYHSGVSDLSLDTDENATEDTIDDIQPMPAFGDLTMDQDMEPTIMTSTNTEKREHLYKILVIGELGTGKTSFIKRYVHQFFSQNYRATIGVDFALKVLHWDPNTIVRLQLWDIAGQERFGNMTRVYYKEAVGAFIVFDVTRSGTFDCVSKWKEDLDSKVQLPDGSPIPCILLANKCDQDKQGVVANSEKMDEYVKEHGFAGWFETSAKENINIDEAARALVNKILLNDKLISAADLADSEKFNLNNSGDQNVVDGKSKCSC